MSENIKKILETQPKMDPDEIHDWIQSLDGVVQRSGKEGAKEILEAI